MSLVAAFALTVLLAPQPKTKPTPVPPPPPGTMEAKKLELLETEVIAEVEKNKDLVQQMDVPRAARDQVSDGSHHPSRGQARGRAFDRGVKVNA